MDLNRLGLFVQVVDAGTLTGAARALGVTTSGVSRGLTTLEQELGVRLLQRTTRKLSLTSAGRAYYNQLRGALAQMNDATLAVSNMGEEPRGAIRITAPPALTPMLMPLIAEFLRRHPKISIELLSSQRMVDLVEDGIDLAVRIGRLRDSSLIARRVAQMITGLYASRDYVRGHGQPKKPEELAGHNCVLFRAPKGHDQWQLNDGERVARVEVSGSIQVDEIPSLHQAVAAGLGIGSMSFFSAARIKNLVRILPRYTSGTLPISLVSPSRRLEPARVVLLRDFLAQRMSALPWRGSRST